VEERCTQACTTTALRRSASTSSCTEWTRSSRLAYQAIDAGVDRAGEGTVFAVTVCSDRDAADRSAEVAAEFVRDALADMEVELFESATGAVSVNRAISQVLEPAHA
jgi:hypothetical protein